MVAAKTTSDAYAIPSSEWPPDPNSQKSTVNTVAREIEEAGGSALALPVNTRDHASIDKLIKDVVSKLGRIDVLIYNSGAIWWSAIETTPLKRYRLMQEVNAEGLYSVIQSCLPVFKSQGYRARIIVVSPPIYSRFTHGKTAYAMTKLAMSILTLGLAKDIERQNHKDMAITSIWPAVAIESAATEFNTPLQQSTEAKAADRARKKDLRKPTIFSDAILAMIRAPTDRVNGIIDTDEDFLRRECGFTDKDFEKYNVVPGHTPRRIMPKQFPDLSVEGQDDEGVRMDSVKLRGGKL